MTMAKGQFKNKSRRYDTKIYQEPWIMNDPTPAPLPHTHDATCRVTYRMTDQMGVVYYGNYLEFFEIGRTELLRATGIAYREMEKDGFFLPVIRSECNYRAPARYDDLLIIRTTVSRLTRVRIEFAYDIFRSSDGTRLSNGETHHAMVDAQGRPRRLNAEWMERLSTR